LNKITELALIDLIINLLDFVDSCGLSLFPLKRLMSDNVDDFYTWMSLVILS